jgi:hypothetical protein
VATLPEIRFWDFCAHRQSDAFHSIGIDEKSLWRIWYAAGFERGNRKSA